MITVKRVYEPASPDDGARYLVDRLWPRGVKKESLRLDDWLKDAAPSDGLRRWFGHDPKKWQEFQRRYSEELDRKPESWQPIAQAARQGVVTLLYGAHDTENNNAVALKEYVETRLERTSRPKSAALPGEKIDFSDVPELMPEPFGRAVVRRGLKPVIRKSQHPRKTTTTRGNRHSS